MSEGWRIWNPHVSADYYAHHSERLEIIERLGLTEEEYNLFAPWERVEMERQILKLEEQ